MNSDITEKLNEVLSDPEKLSQVMAIVNAFRAGDAPKDPVSTDADSPPQPDEAAAAPASLPLPASRQGSHVKGDKRVGLLLALKPYLSAPRAEKVDKILRIISLGEVAGQFKNLL